MTERWHRALLFVRGRPERVDEREQSVLQEVDEEPRAPPERPFFNLGQVSQRYQDGRHECSRVLRARLSISNLLLLFVPSAPLGPRRRCLSHGARLPGEKEARTFYLLRVRRANAAGVKAAC